MNKQEIKEVWNGLKSLCENGNTHEIREIARKSLNLITDISAQSERLCNHINRLTGGRIMEVGKDEGTNSKS